MRLPKIDFKKINITPARVMSVFVISVVFSSSLSMVGQTPSNCFDPFTWVDVFKLNFFVGLLFTLGLFVGKGK